MGLHVQRIAGDVFFKFRKAAFQLGAFFFQLNFLGGKFFQSNRVALLLQFQRRQFVAGVVEAVLQFAGFGLGLLLIGLACANGGVDGIERTSFFDNVLSGALQRMGGITELLIDALQFGVHLFAAFLGAGDVGLGFSVLSG